MKCDVLVLGGGSTGFVAAIAASRLGAHTTLVERAGMLGGMASLALANTICGLFIMREALGVVYAYGGLPREFAQAEGALEVLFHSEIVGSSRAGQRGDGAEIVCRGRSAGISTRAVIDARGDGISAPLLGDDFDQASGAALRRPAYIVEDAGIDPEALDPKGRMFLSHLIASDVRARSPIGGALGCCFRKGVCVSAFLSLDLDPPEEKGYDLEDPRCLAEIEMGGSAFAAAIFSFLRANWGGHFRDARLSALLGRAGVREILSLPGRAALDADSIFGRRQSDEDVELATWPMAVRETARGPRLIPRRGGAAAGLPPVCLHSAFSDNLFFRSDVSRPRTRPTCPRGLSAPTWPRVRHRESTRHCPCLANPP